uniref:Uncharacterized protein n=1 Tax=Rhizophora mucronata TaxID=61149 RepID=A0A2P2Q6W6_RHIMU
MHLIHALTLQVYCEANEKPKAIVQTWVANGNKHINESFKDIIKERKLFTQRRAIQDSKNLIYNDWRFPPV